MSRRALTLADVLDEVRRQGADPDSVRIYVCGRPLDADSGEWSVDRRDGGPTLDMGYEDDDDGCDCIECPDLDAHAKATVEEKVPANA